MSKMIHYEDLWNISEPIAKNRYTSSTEAITKLKELADTLTRVHQNHLKNPTNEIAKQMKHDQIGSILFAITAISAWENIDVYAALKQMYEVEKFNQELTVGIDSILDQAAEKLDPGLNTVSSVESPSS